MIKQKSCCASTVMHIYYLFKYFLAGQLDDICVQLIAKIMSVLTITQLLFSSEKICCMKK